MSFSIKYSINSIFSFNSLAMQKFFSTISNDFGSFFKDVIIVLVNKFLLVGVVWFKISSVKYSI